jgi:hypothetical protein
MMAGRQKDREWASGNAMNAADRPADTAADATETAAATAEPAGISRAGGKGRSSNRGSRCESEDEFA